MLGSIYYVKDYIFDRIHNAESDDEKWGILFETSVATEIWEARNFSGLDHINQTKKQITFSDVGVSRGGKMYDNTFTIRRVKTDYFLNTNQKNVLG